MIARFIVLTAFIATAVLPIHAASPAPAKSQQKYEISFMTDMIDHHAMAVMMAYVCMDRAVHEELRTLCEQMREAQMQEIVQMQTWLEEWYGVQYEPQMTKGGQKQMARLAQSSGKEFEIEFMQEMIKHHSRAIVAAEQCQKRAYHPELIELCENMEWTQTEEIHLMSDWLCEWYNICEFGSR
jgi:uncharacterized protein (DUF305 family)